MKLKDFIFSGHGSGSGIELLGDDWNSDTFFCRRIFITI